MRKIVINCYKYHGREDLLPTFADEEDKINNMISNEEEDEEEKVIMQPVSNNNTITTIQTVSAHQPPPTATANVSFKVLIAYIVGVSWHSV